MGRDDDSRTHPPTSGGRSYLAQVLTHGRRSSALLPYRINALMTVSCLRELSHPAHTRQMIPVGAEERMFSPENNGYMPR